MKKWNIVALAVVIFIISIIAALVKTLGSPEIENIISNSFNCRLSYPSWLNKCPRVLRTAIENLSIVSPSIISIDLDQDPLPYFHLNDLCRIKSLQALSIYYTISDWNSLGCLAKVSDFKSLTVGFNKINGSSVEVINKLQNLEYLVIGQCEFADPGDAGSIDIPNLISLEIYSCDPEKVWGMVNWNTNLLRLTLRNDKLSSKDLSSVLPELPNLRYLNLRHNPIDNQITNDLNLLKNLGELDMQETDINNEFIAALKSCQSITNLNLSFTSLDDNSVPLLKSLTNVSMLYVSNTKLSDSAAKELKKTFSYPRIIWTEP